jgi:hypothetical protein
LDGTHLDLIVGSTDGIYKIHFDGTNGNDHIDFNSSNWDLWQWRTFHYDAARTGCTTTPSTTKVSASIIGRVRTANGTGLADIEVEIVDLTTNQNPVVHNRPDESRRQYVLIAGDATNDNEINEGGYVINQLTPGRNYLLKFKRLGYADKTYTLNNAVVGINTIADIVY